MRKHLALLVVAIFALTNTWVVYKAYAVTVVTRHLVPGCANNGDGTSSSCAAGAGAAGAYNSMSNALSDIQTDYASFVASDVQVTLRPYTGTAIDTANSLTINATMDSTRYLLIQTQGVDRANGLYQGYRLQCGGSNDSCIIINGTNAAKVIVDGLAFKGTVPDGSGRGAIFTVTNNVYSEISNNFFWYAQSSGTANTSVRNCAIDGDSVAGSLYARNNTIYNFRIGIHLRSIFQTGSNFQVDANTIVDSRQINLTFEMDGASDTLGVYNNLLKGAPTDYSVGSAATTYNHGSNSTSDTTSPDGAGYQSKTFTFVNAASQDYHITSGDTGAKGLGTDCSVSCTGYVFTDDADGATRSVPWDNGMDQVSTPTPTPTPSSSARKAQRCVLSKIAQCN